MGYSSTPIADHRTYTIARTPGQAVAMARTFFLSAIGRVIGIEDQSAHLAYLNEFDANEIYLALYNFEPPPYPGGLDHVIRLDFPVGISGFPLDWFLLSPGWNGQIVTYAQRDDDGNFDPGHTLDLADYFINGTKDALLSNLCSEAFSYVVQSVDTQGQDGSGPILRSRCHHVKGTRGYFTTCEQYYCINQDDYDTPDGATLQRFVGDTSFVATPTSGLGDIAKALQDISNMDVDLSINNGQTIFSVRGRTVTS